MVLKQLTIILLMALILGSYSAGTALAQHPSNRSGLAQQDASDCSVLHKTNATSAMIILCSIAPTDDTYADNLIPTKTFGDLGVLIVQNIPSVPISKNYAFIKFDLAKTLPAQVAQSGAIPLNASLRMYVRMMNFFYNATVEVHNVPAQNWTENTVTWNNMPQFDANEYTSTNIRQNGTWARWNLTNLVQERFNSGGQISFAAIASETSWRNLVWFDSKEHVFSNGTTAPTLQLAFVEPYLTIETSYPNIAISVGGREVATNANGTAQQLLPWGDYSVSVPDTITIRNGTRARFVDWNDRTNSSTRLISVGNNLTLKANYGIQHELDVQSALGTVTGGGWYFENTDATITITPTSVPLEGFMGWFGGRYVFDHWSGACTTTASQCDVLMDSPKNTVAVWRVDWTLTIILVIILAVTTACVAVLRKKRRRAGRKVKIKRSKRRSVTPRHRRR
ncbi:MAG: DNRLRE domain-containing protein, partial [Candidatus Bathyarchaeia archaeon]